MRNAIRILCVMSVGGLCSVVSAVGIEMVRVGDPGNAANNYGYGAVSYEYNIGKYEVTAGQYRDFLNNVATADPYGLYNSYMVSDPYGCQITQHGTSGNYTYDFSGRPSGTESDWTNRPVNYVSWYDTLRFANWITSGDTESGSYPITGGGPNSGTVTIPTANQRALWSNGSDRYVLLTSEDEWCKAAYYDPSLNGGAGGYYLYPTGSDSVPSNDLTNPDDGNNATYYTTISNDDWGDDFTIGSPYYRTEIGAHESSDSPYGTFDQGGNVYEWNEATVSESYRSHRGASFAMYSHHMRWTFRNNLIPRGERSYIGFRVAEVPEPATLGMFLLGGLAMLRRRKRWGRI